MRRSVTRKSGSATETIYSDSHMFESVRVMVPSRHIRHRQVRGDVRCVITSMGMNKHLADESDLSGKR